MTVLCQVFAAVVLLWPASFVAKPAMSCKYGCGFVCLLIYLFIDSSVIHKD